VNLARRLNGHRFLVKRVYLRPFPRPPENNDVPVTPILFVKLLLEVALAKMRSTTATTTSGISSSVPPSHGQRLPK
jgi:hypothetical protein